MPPAPTATNPDTSKANFANLPDDILVMIIKLLEKKHPLLLTCKSTLFIAGDLIYGESDVLIDSVCSGLRRTNWQANKHYIGKLVDGAELEGPSTYRPFGRELKAHFLARITSLTVSCDEMTDYHNDKEEEKHDHDEDILLLKELKTLPHDLFPCLSRLFLRTHHLYHDTRLIRLALALSALCHPDTFTWSSHGYAGYQVRRGLVEDPQLRFAGGHLPKEVVYHLVDSYLDIYWPIPCHGTSNQVVVWGSYSGERGGERADRCLRFLRSVHPECRKAAERMWEDEHGHDGDDDGARRDATTWSFTWKKKCYKDERQYFDPAAGWTERIMEEMRERAKNRLPKSWKERVCFTVQDPIFEGDPEWNSARGYYGVK